MNVQTSMNRDRHLRTLVALAGAVGLMLSIGSGAGWGTADQAQAGNNEETRVKEGRCVSEAGTLLYRPKRKGSWQVAKPKEAVYTRDLLLALPGSRAQVETSNGAVHLSLAGNWPADENPSLLESAVRLHGSKRFDLDFTLDRGRVILKNRKKKDGAQVRVRFQDDRWDLTLDDPGTEVALELVRRWLFTPSVTGKAKPADKPETSVVLIVLHGEAGIKVGTDEFSLRAPPGPALFSWGSRRGSSGPASLKELPAWANKEKTSRDPKIKAAQAALEKLRRKMERKSVAVALADALHGSTAAGRSLAVYCSGAVDDLSSVLDALDNKKHAEVRLAGLHALRHWSGRGEQNPARQHRALLKKRYSRGQAAIFAQLLFGFSAEQLARPETYAVLIEYLKHDRPAIREMAHWHLVMQVPDGRKIPFDAGGKPEDLKKAYAAWKKLIPDGELPGRRKPKKEG
jgi:hypothetical protein